ncbi:MAG: TetR family transcriptional regulator [Cellulomonas sp. 73-145]|uniref:TetR/AcrR family transcriptional regulator n=1 Tax=Cellulomonas sp. 73-145 TaxID=1895739 RepID=UPI0009282C2E|nr:TetR family transcriptional regulator [Cellulomonas sp. 73-145]OJV59827.1 MAG: TetR family transcriptional regulator [Cellulomonas sp. 73-145]
MGRVRTFDEGAVTRSALGAFWERGYAETAVPELEDATGLNRSSLYHAFGSKRGLFDAAVERYLDEVVRPRLAPLLADRVAAGALGDYLRELREAMLGGLPELAANGCLLMNATASSLGHDAALQHVVARYHADLRAAIGAGVAAHRPDLDAEATRDLATACTAMVLASMMIVRVNPAAAGEMLATASRTLG